jgi:hypothetical protein
MQKTEIKHWPEHGGLVAIDTPDKPYNGVVLKVGGIDKTYEVLLTGSEARDVARALESLASTPVPPWRKGADDGEEE